MKILTKSNFVIPGLEEEESLELSGSEITLMGFFKELSKRSPDPLEYVEQGADRLDPDDWEVDINDVPYQDYEEGLGKILKDGDRVTIRIMAQGGG